MSSSSYLVWFVLTAVMTNVVIYGGIALAYFSDKRRAERLRAVVGNAVPAGDRSRSTAHARGLRDAA